MLTIFAARATVRSSRHARDGRAYRRKKTPRCLPGCL